MLTLEELAVATQLVEGHLSLDISSPVSVILFLISRQWSYYKTQELSMVMQPMGALQPGLPFPYAVPFTWDLMVLKDAYLLVPLYLQDLLVLFLDSLGLISRTYG